ncbi:GNAT family N-acetyltransferase [Psychromonas sp. 14N.309.X.WAT.B.A12]|jgi:N-acetylglutamate synthase-like GNAT family acetyltransferase|uniref:GNAT family N-acetyltransferase n=1 Tax=unclassified Psychromonas TaxID=2614957 RepID=UPI0025B06642|nr:GNAT family N-acetyltransferase [Psychromonas sp. 14N.309.X.WAT.B.A12]MDN2663060.1 GNAT family N-acetyltransferase [Psychromonas sp. 14N.309.X.WAT.B.A12]
MNNEFTIREAKTSDLDRCYEIERAAYAGDEAATKEKILCRIQQYPQGFLVLENDREIIGFVNSGATHHVQLSDEAFKELVGHDATGKHIVVMSVVVHPNYQGKGYADTLLGAFIQKMKGINKSNIYLICQTELIHFYAKHGFIHLGESDSLHGGLSWHEMSLSL